MPWKTTLRSALSLAAAALWAVPGLAQSPLLPEPASFAATLRIAVETREPQICRQALERLATYQAADIGMHLDTDHDTALVNLRRLAWMMLASLRQPRPAAPTAPAPLLRPAERAALGTLAATAALPTLHSSDAALLLVPLIQEWSLFAVLRSPDHEERRLAWTLVDRFARHAEMEVRLTETLLAACQQLALAQPRYGFAAERPSPGLSAIHRNVPDSDGEAGRLARSGLAALVQGGLLVEILQQSPNREERITALGLLWFARGTTMPPPVREEAQRQLARIFDAYLQNAPGTRAELTADDVAGLQQLIDMGTQPDDHGHPA